MQQVKMDPGSVTNIQHLNDDCLREIFRRSELSDLGAIADVCKRFRWIAREQFQLLYGEKLDLRCVFRMSDTPEQYMKQVSQVIRNFGEFIWSITAPLVRNRLGAIGNKNQTIELIMRYCRQTLRELYFNWDTHHLRTEELVELIKNMPRLRIFRYNDITLKGSSTSTIKITDKIYRKLLDIVERRRPRTHLTIDLINVTPIHGTAKLINSNEEKLTIYMRRDPGGVEL